MKRALIATLALVFGFAMNGTLAADGPGDWKRLGQKMVDHKAERDEIDVGKDEGLFKSIKIEVRGADVHFINVRVVYANGNDQEIELRNEIRAGGETRVIDLDGRNRAIRKVVFVYKTDKKERRKGTVVLLGRR
jgi:hypothetical protein